MGFQGGGYNLPPLLILVTRCNQIFSKLSNTKNRTQTCKTSVRGFFLIIFSTYFASRLQFPLPSLLLFPPPQQLCFSRYKKKWKRNGVFCRNVAYCSPVQQRVTCAFVYVFFSSRLWLPQETQSLTEWLLAVFPLTMAILFGSLEIHYLDSSCKRSELISHRCVARMQSVVLITMPRFSKD